MILLVFGESRVCRVRLCAVGALVAWTESEETDPGERRSSGQGGGEHDDGGDAEEYRVYICVGGDGAGAVGYSSSKGYVG